MILYLLEACITSSIFARPFPCPEFLALLKQLSNDVEAASPQGFDPSAKASVQSLAMYEVSTTLQMGKGAMLANISREVPVFGRSDSTRASAAWQRAVPCPALPANEPTSCPVRDAPPQLQSGGLSGLDNIQKIHYCPA